MKAIAAGALLVPAALFGASATLAADLLPVEPIDYVRVCAAYGTGFLIIPGTETCLKLAGRIRADYNFYLTPNDDILDAVGLDPAQRQSYRFRARGNIYLDSRTATEFGLLRTYLDFETTVDSLDQGNLPPGVTRDPADVSLESAYIEYAGLTFGRTQSFYDFTDVAYSAAQQFDPAYSDRNLNLAAYTYRMGALSATLALEDTTARWYDIAGGFHGGAQIPDVVGRLRYESDAFGSAQLMAAGHAVSAVGYIPPGIPGYVPPEDEEYGFAVGGGVSLNVPFGNGTKVGVTASYARGALTYLSVDIASQIGVYDGALGTDLVLSEGFSVSGGFSTRITATIGLGVNLGYVSVDGPDAPFDFDLDGKPDDLSLSNIDAQAYLTYEPVADFRFGLGTEYRLTDTKDFSDGSIFTTFVRAERRF